MFIATRAARSAKLRRSGMFIGTPNQQRSAPSSVRSGMEPFVWSPIRHAAPDGAWFPGGHLSYKLAAPTELWATGRPRLGGCASAINMPLLRSYGRRAAPDSGGAPQL